MVFNKDTKLFTLQRLLDKIIITVNFDLSRGRVANHEMFARATLGNPEKFTVISQTDWFVLEPIIKVICRQFDLVYNTTEKIHGNITVGFVQSSEFGP